jgi:multiple sugar transport system permease protein
MAGLADVTGQGRRATGSTLLALLEREQLLGYLLLAPAVLYILALIGYPFVLAIWIALSDQTVSGGSQGWAGLENFEWALDSSLFRRALTNTLVFAFGSEIIKMILGTSLAFLLIRPFRGRRLARALVIVPWAMPIAISVIAWRWMFDALYSVINWAGVHLGLLQNPPNWLGQPDTAMWAIIIVNVWRGFPFSAIILMAGLTSVPQDILDAARVDGANWWQRYRQIIVPMIAPILYIALLFSLVFSLTDLTVVYLLTRGGPVNSTHVLSSLAFDIGIVAGGLSRGAAISLFLFPALLILAFWLLRLLKRRDI